MKKYNQLLLLIISVVSLTLFLIYRHEYNRLHYVLEVFNFFGQPCNISSLQESESVLSHRDWGPIPLWQETDNGYIYSAFLTSPNETKTLVVSDPRKMPKNCYYWYEEKSAPIAAKIKFSKIAYANNYHLFFYNCIGLRNETNVPYAVSFSNKVGDSNYKVLLTKTYDHQVKINTTICVVPSVFNKRLLIEFLSYHKIIGIDSFIFYSNDIPHRLLKIITNLSIRLGLQVAFFPWNYPKINRTLTRTIIENDCLLRTFGQNLYVTTLEINEYINLMDYYNFDTMMQSFSKHVKRVVVPVQEFCIKNTKHNIPISMQNFHVHNKNKSVQYIYKNTEKIANYSWATDVTPHAYIYKYVKCSSEPKKWYFDKSIDRFSTDLTRSTLVQLLMHDQL